MHMLTKDSFIPSLNTLSPVTEDEGRKIISSGISNSCALDPILTPPPHPLNLALTVFCYQLLTWCPNKIIDCYNNYDNLSM